MKLTAFLLRRKLPKGHIFQGKHRLVREVDAKALKNLRFDYEREERNMLILRHPYLTVEQSYGHMIAMGKPEVKRLDWEAEIIKKFSKVTTLEDRLMHLKVKDAWE